MIREDEALHKIRKQGFDPVSCRFLDDFYVFTLRKDGSSYLAVSRNTGKVLPYSPSLDFTSFCEAEVRVYDR